MWHLCRKRAVLAKKQPKQKRKVYLILFLIIGIGALLAYNALRSKRIVRYAGFGIQVPASFSVHGIDVSKHQGEIDWPEVSTMVDNGKHIEFVFLKSTEGTSISDPRFSVNYVQAKKEKLLVGAYHFFIPSRSGEAQAKKFIQHTPLESGDLAPVLDIEKFYGCTKESLQKELKVWLNLVENKYGVKPLIYTNAKFYENYLKGALDDYPLWVAHYKVYDKPEISRNWEIWQHSEEGNVNGITEHVDFNVFNGSLSQLKRLTID